ncbi:hypothetical protein FGO68_gene12362 [Halteria grandinella]|uniref:Uncharacterized protein n=1 Tax=Halteria grandinella TaxID=5974 RepID=A0A8J8NU55_HALGN|nr:hypothetical protein FGO68_gene12362 [Halteria grandinella]
MYDSDASVDSGALTQHTSSPRQSIPIKLQSLSQVFSQPIPVRLPSLKVTLPQLTPQDQIATLSQSLPYPEMVQTRALPQPNLKVPSLNEAMHASLTSARHRQKMHEVRTAETERINDHFLFFMRLHQ